ncbi:unnamed protein product [Adineta ricciae]|uniref:Uncharacterized protein n=1 Tax=Adineta ricciae TaxID=249248 RepID=A0A815SJU0_ADIRI|nr:unnamed protein product [Adineta ricciae]
MVEEALSNFGLFIDSENKIRLIDPEKVTDSAELRDECKDFVDNVLEFKKIVDTLIEKTEQYSKQVESARLRSIGAKNMLKSATKYREFEKQQLQSLIKEKMIELDRLRTEYESLQKTEREQNEKMEQLSLKSGTCDVSCCCDIDCSASDLQVLNCYAQQNQDAQLESIVHTTCFKDLSLYQSNSPYVIRKENGFVCIDQEKSVNYTFYQQQLKDKMDANAFTRAISLDNSVSLSAKTPTSLTEYQAGTSIFKYFPASNVSSTFSLPIGISASAPCSSTRTITYMNDFSSTCTQQVTQQTCTIALNPAVYLTSFSLVTNPTTLKDASVTTISCGTSPTASNWTSPTCTGALQTLNLVIYYTNPTGIQNCNVSYSTIAASSTLQQTFTVKFVRNGTVLSPVSRSGNPGYIQRAAVLAGTANGNTITESEFTIPQSSDSCSSIVQRTVRFGQNTQSTCLLQINASAANCPNINDVTNVLMPINATTLRIAASGSPDSSTISSPWLSVTYCVSETGSTADAVCQQNSIPTWTTGQCYDRVDIQIAYANVGSVSNPQPIIGAVVFHYQRSTVTNTTLLSKSLLLTRTVTFQDVSNLPVTQGDHLPRPNTRLPGDFFYAFFRNQATILNPLSLFVSLLINMMLMFVLM